MSTASARLHALHAEQFTAHGRVYRWFEGEPSSRAEGARARAMEIFTRAVVPQLERRHAIKLTQSAAQGGARWVAWRAPGEAALVWALYAPARVIDPRATEPANDTLALVAWGDGPVLAWAHEGVAARALVRAALHVPPSWLAEGFRSADPTLPVRVDWVANAAGAGPTLSPPALVLDSPAPAAPPANPALAILQAWKRKHGREPLTY